MAIEPVHDTHPRRAEVELPAPLPRPSLRFRIRAWRVFQRALDPLASPRTLPRRDSPKAR